MHSPAAWPRVNARIAGFFGMNVGGVPLADDPHGFWVLVALVVTFTALAGRWAFRKRSDF